MYSNRCLFSIDSNEFNDTNLDTLLSTNRNITCIYTPLNVCFDCLEETEFRTKINNLLRRTNDHIQREQLITPETTQPELDNRTTIHYDELNDDYYDNLQDNINDINQHKEQLIINNSSITYRTIISKFYNRHCKRRKFYICCHKIFLESIREIEPNIFELNFTF